MDTLEWPHHKGGLGGTTADLLRRDEENGTGCRVSAGLLSTPLYCHPAPRCVLNEPCDGSTKAGTEFTSVTGQKRLILAVHQGQRRCAGGGGGSVNLFRDGGGGDTE